MTQNMVEQELHSEIDNAIDNLFGQYTGNKEKSKEQPAAKPTSSSDAGPAGDDPSFQEPPANQEILRLEEALLSLDWEISSANIEETARALQGIQAILNREQQDVLAELLAVMQEILEAIADSPRSVPTTVPKTMQDGMEAIKAAMTTEEMPMVEQNMIAPAMAKLRAAIAHVHEAGRLEPAATETSPPPETRPQPATTNRAADFIKTDNQEKPAPQASSAADQATTPEVDPPLVTAIKAHLTILDKCINKRIVPMEKLFAKNRGYEKLQAVHTDLRKHLERQQKMLGQALTEARRASETVGPATPSSRQSSSAPAVCPWKSLAVTTRNDRRVAFVPDEIAFQGIPGRKKYSGPFFPLKNLKKGLFGKVRRQVSGDLTGLAEDTLKNMLLPLAPDEAPKRGDKSPIVLLFKENAGAVFRVESTIELLQVTSEWQWLPTSDPGSMVAGELKRGEETVTVITARPASLPEG